MINPRDWKWFGFPGHFILSSRCKFHLTTQVGNKLVSTVGALTAKEHLGDMEISEFDDVGLGRKFETMVFHAGTPCDFESCNCGLPEIDGCELHMMGANDADVAQRNHFLCCEWASEHQDL